MVTRTSMMTTMTMLLVYLYSRSEPNRRFACAERWLFLRNRLFEFTVDGGICSCKVYDNALCYLTNVSFNASRESHPWLFLSLKVSCVSTFCFLCYYILRRRKNVFSVRVDWMEHDELYRSLLVFNRITLLSIPCRNRVTRGTKLCHIDCLLGNTTRYTNDQQDANHVGQQ